MIDLEGTGGEAVRSEVSQAMLVATPWVATVTNAPENLPETVEAQFYYLGKSPGAGQQPKQIDGLPAALRRLT